MRLILSAVVLLVAACAAPGSSDASAPAVIDGAGAGFQTKVSSNLDLVTAASATAAAPAATKSELSRLGYSGGTERVFTRGDEFVTVVAFTLSTDVDAGQFVAFERDALKSTPAAVVYDDAQVPGAFGYDLSGGTRSGGRLVFCQGVWFAVHSTAYGLTDCAGSPRYPDLVESLAVKQYHAAGGGA